MQNILITGGSGLIGKELTEVLLKAGYEVSHLSRTKKPNSNIKVYTWDLASRKIEDEAIINADYIIHLAGAGVADKKWSPERKKEILESRTASGELLFEKVKELNPQLKAFISASGIGFYGSEPSARLFTEEDSKGDDFLAEVCYQWELQAQKFESIGIRSISLRTGVVLSKKGGALEKIKIPVKMFIGSALGNGKQFMPWVHITDLCEIYKFCIENDNLKGVFNASCPDHKTNKEFTRTLCKVMKRPFIPVPVPAFMLKLLLGEMSVILLSGNRISAEKLINRGFKFQYPELKRALTSLIKQ